MNTSLAFLASACAAATLCASCSPFSSRRIHDAPYDASAVPIAPSYGQDVAWAALPSRVDEADGFPTSSRYPNRQATATADVFFIYPTLFTNEPGERFPWNASVTDADLNERIDESTVRMQASVFNAAGRVYVPRYRQAHIAAYYTDDSTKAKAAFDVAYEDVRAAFKVFLRKYNQGRPILIAGHSQGTTMAKRLVRDYFDPGGPLLGGADLPRQLVAAYLVGIAVEPDWFASLPVCEEPAQTRCFVSWRTWQRPATPLNPKGKKSENEAFPQTADVPTAIVVNPLSWRTDTLHVTAEANPGGILRKLKLRSGLVDAQVQHGILWIERPKFFGSFLIRMDNWHVADYNLYYESVRRNVVERVEAFNK